MRTMSHHHEHHFSHLMHDQRFWTAMLVAFLLGVIVALVVVAATSGVQLPTNWPMSPYGY